MRSYMAIAMCLLVVSAACGQNAGDPVSPHADSLAAGGLHHSVMLLRHASERPVARAARLVGLAEFARRLAPDDPDINNTIAYIFLVRKKDQQVAMAVKKSFSARPLDHALGLQWMSSEMKRLQDAQTRSTFLGALMTDTARTPELRAAAAVNLADILIGQGHRKDASTAFDTAVKLDPNLPAALAGKLMLAEKASPIDQARVWTAELAVNPHSVQQAAQLGEILDAAGLAEQAARFYDYAWRVNRTRGLGARVSLDFAVRHCNALLNAGRHKQAVEIFGPLSRRFSESVLLRVMLIEACNHTSQPQRAKMYAGEIEAIFAPQITAGQPDASAAAELAWLNLITGSDIPLALEYAKRAATLRPDAPESTRALAVAQILSKDASIVDSGRVSLKKIVDKDVFAAAFLAEHYYRVRRPEDGKKLVLSGLSLSRSGQAARRLLALAKEHKIAVPPADGAKELKAIAESIPESLLQLGLAPEKFFDLKVIAPKKIDARSGIVVRVELSNKYDRRISAGLGGMIPATVRIDVTAEGRRTGKFIDVARLLLPVGRYIAGGKKISVTGRIDVGKLHDFLVAHPLDDLKLTISPKLVNPGDKTPGELTPPTKAIAAAAPAVITRTSILGEFNRDRPTTWRSTYKHCLSLIVGDMKVKDLKVRIRAAHQIASLLVLSDGIKSGNLRPPKELAGQINREVLVLMTTEMLKNPSDVVRAEMLAALGDVKLDGKIIRGFGGIIKDRSPLVRFRLVELLGASGLAGQKPILNHFAKDKYDLVANLAKAMQAPPKKN